MEIRVLRYFLAVAREQSISGAAESLHLTQPTLSRQLMDLEEELDSKLLLRGNRRVSLTEQGMLLRKRAQEIVDLVDKTQAEFSEPGETVSGDIYIGGGETDAMRMIAKTAKGMQRDYPLIRFHLFSGNAEDVAERLDKGLLDFGIFIEPADMKKYDDVQLPAVDVWGLLLPKDHPLAAQEAIHPDDLLGLPLLTSRQALVQNVFSGWMGRGFDKLQVVATYNLIYNASLMVEEGFGCALCLDKLVNTTGQSGLCFRPLEPRVESRLDIVWKKYQVFSKAAERFLQRLESDFTSESG